MYLSVNVEIREKKTRVDTLPGNTHNVLECNAPIITYKGPMIQQNESGLATGEPELPPFNVNYSYVIVVFIYNFYIIIMKF